jgi:hypothetical protein
VDKLKRAFYEQLFRNEFRERRGEAFQDFFAQIMEKRYPRGDFQRVRPWGNDGDRKNDGYVRSRRILFQCYAPDELTAAKCKAKIDEDFAGALPHWKDYFNTWVFVHNALGGVGPGVAETLLLLEAAKPPFKVEAWSYNELRAIMRELDEQAIADILGPAPSQRDVSALGLQDLMPILDHLARLPPATEPDVRPVPPDKLARNMLSDDVAVLIRTGMTKADLVKKYFRDRPTLQDRIATGVQVEYRRLRDLGTSPDEIFASLQRHCAGSDDSTRLPSRQVAVLAVLAFFFETCDIFERPEPLEGQS